MRRLFDALRRRSGEATGNADELGRRAAAAHAGLSLAEFERLVTAGELPRPCQRLGRRVWSRRALDDALAKIGRRR